MARTAWRLRLALCLAVGLAVTGLWLVVYGTGVFRELDLDTVDWRFSIRSERDVPQFAVVGMDASRSMTSTSTRWSVVATRRSSGA